MLLSLKRGTDTAPPPTLRFNNATIENVTSHKHLGITITSRLDWSEHITNILESVSLMTNVLKLLKYRLDRRTLETIYFSFIRPKLEYGCQIFSNCGIVLSSYLENFQLGVARIVSGARRGTHHALLYDELDWETLQERRKSITFKSFSKIVSHSAPEYLFELLPDRVGARRNLRNAADFELIPCRTETYRSSFFPYCVKNWKTSSLVDHRKPNCNPLFYYGKRETSVKVAQLRMRCSKLNAHLKELHVIDSASCACGHDVEDASHYLLSCPLFMNDRNIFITKLRSIGICNINAHSIVNGSLFDSFELNRLMFDALFTYIEDTDRL